VLGQIKIK